MRYDQLYGCPYATSFASTAYNLMTDTVGIKKKRWRNTDTWYLCYRGGNFEIFYTCYRSPNDRFGTVRYKIISSSGRLAVIANHEDAFTTNVTWVTYPTDEQLVELKLLGLIE